MVEEYKNAKGTDNEVGATDETAVEMIQTQVKNIYDERAAFVQALDNAQKGLDNYVPQAEIEHRLQDLQLEHFGLKDEHKTYLIHDVDEFWELEKKKFEYQVREQRAKDDSTIKGFEMEIDRCKDMLESFDKKLQVKFDKLKELGADIPEDPYAVKE